MKRSFNYKSLLNENNPLNKYPMLLEAALNEFSNTKFEDASLNDILKNAQMSKGSFYHNFGDKFGLYLAVLDKVTQKKDGVFLLRHEIAPV